jgi:flavodoxin
MKSHFIDIDILIKNESKPWIISKENPNIPIMKIEPSDFKIFKSGVFRNQNNRLDFNGKTFWLSNDFMNKVKLAAKKYKADVSNLAISLQEYLNKDVVDNIDFQIDMSIFNSIVNTDDHIYIICSKNTKKNYEKAIEKLEDKMKEIGLKIQNFYYISETFFNRNDDDISYLKVKLILQHLIGLKTESDKITNDEITNYNQIYFYDDSKSAIELAKRINNVLESLLVKTEKDVKAKIKDEIRSGDNILVVREYTHNKSKRFLETIVELEYSNVIKNFENYRNE